MAQKILSFITFFVILGLVYFFIVDEERVETMDVLSTSDETLHGDVNSTVEQYDRFDHRLRGNKKHLYLLRQETEVHIKKYIAKVDSINDSFDQITLDIEDLETEIIQKLEEISEEIVELDESFKTFGRNQNRSLGKIKERLDNLEYDVKKLDQDINPPAEPEENSGSK